MDGQKKSKKKEKKSIVLIADDNPHDIEFLMEALKSYKKTDGVEILTARNGLEAIDILQSVKVDLVVTDLKMPEADGFQVLAHIINNFPSLSVIVTTGYVVPDIIKKVSNFGVDHLIEKPFDMEKIARIIVQELRKEKTGRVEGINIATFIQMMEMEKKTAVIIVASGARRGILHIKQGELCAAESGELKDKDAAIEILSWDHVRIELQEVLKVKGSNFCTPLSEILLESFRLKDEQEKGKKIPEKADADVLVLLNKEDLMAIKEHLDGFKEVSGYLGSGVFTPQGEMLEGSTEVSGIHFATAGSMIHQIMFNSQTMAKEAGFGHTDMIQLDTEMGLIFCKCYNDQKNTHFHTVLVIKNDGNVAMAKMKIKKTVENLIKEF